MKYRSVCLGRFRSHQSVQVESEIHSASLRARNTPPLSPTLVSKLPQEWSLLHRLLYELSAERRDVSCENTGAPLNPLRVYGLSHG